MAHQVQAQEGAEREIRIPGRGRIILLFQMYYTYRIPAYRELAALEDL
jgi:hypothetical protein